MLAASLLLSLLPCCFCLSCCSDAGLQPLVEWNTRRELDTKVAELQVRVCGGGGHCLLLSGTHGVCVGRHGLSTKVAELQVSVCEGHCFLLSETHRVFEWDTWAEYQGGGAAGECGGGGAFGAGEA